MVRHSEKYTELVAGGLRPGRCISVEAAEYLSGLPRRWTSPHPGMVNPADVDKYFPDVEAWRHAAHADTHTHMHTRSSLASECMRYFFGVIECE